MIIIGINSYHGDSSACIIVDGQLVAAVEEERFRRIKHWAGLPTESIRYCLEEARITFDQVDAIAINQDSNANLWKKIAYTLTNRPNLGLVLDRIKNKRERLDILDQLSRTFPNQQFNGKVHKIEHHLAHLYSAFYVSPFEQAVTVSIDGFGDFSSGAWGVGRGKEIVIDGRVLFPHSLGIFYQALTQYLGFPNYGDEYKVMGLAPYGEKKYLSSMREIVLLQDDGSYRLNLEYFLHHKESVATKWEGGSPVFGRLFSDKLIDLFGPVRAKSDRLTQVHMDIAHSIQAMYEEAFFHLLNKLHEKHGLDAVTVAGGCGMNSVANGKITRFTPFKNVYVQSAAGDAGGAIGAAFAVCKQKDKSNLPRFFMDHAYWGPQYSNSEIGKILNKKSSDIKRQGCVIKLIEDENKLFEITSEAISEGKVVGWFQGRMEWGPRALGNRSILCDPRRSDIKDILNLKIKKRESFRPFAPSILREKVSEWFEQDEDVPFMMKVFQVKKEKRKDIPAVTHADGSGRLQTVFKNSNLRYYKLIDAFYKKTGVPIVLNTSFNENEPVVCKPEEALACFLRTKMDVLVMGDYMVLRSDS